MNWSYKFSQSWEGIDWPIRPEVGDKINEQDSPPEITPEQDYVLYHGTSLIRAKKIISDRRLLSDDIGNVGISTTHRGAHVYGSMKAAQEKSQSAVLRLVIDGEWLRSQRISREVGGSGYKGAPLSENRRACPAV